VPYYTRKEIDGDRVLAGRRLELAYLERYWDTMTLQIQGGGYVELADGRYLRLSYAAGNNRGYRAVGRILVEEGHIPREELSMQAIDAYFTAHPQDLERVCFMNDSYVFFSASGPHERLTPDLHPAGVLGFPLTPRRSIATDKRWFPGGGLAFIAGRQRRADGTSTPFSGFVLDQDTGGAIRGGHIDFFLGIGDAAGEDAGRMRDRQGRLYFLVARPAPSTPGRRPGKE
jgi:membrane-bound lytic murein transglycosylase A